MDPQPKHQKKGRKAKTPLLEKPAENSENSVIVEKPNVEVKSPTEVEENIVETPIANLVVHLDEEDIIPEFEEEQKENAEDEKVNKLRTRTVEEIIVDQIPVSVEDVIEGNIETVIEDVKKSVSIEIKSLLNLLIIISARPELQDKYSLTTEMVKVLKLILQSNPTFFFKIEDSFKKILEDNQIDSNDVPELMALFSLMYELLVSLKYKKDSLDLSNICGDIVKLTFDIMITEGIISVNSESSELMVATFKSLVDSSISLINLSKAIKASNTCCIIC